MESKVNASQLHVRPVSYETGNDLEDLVVWQPNLTNRASRAHTVNFVQEFAVQDLGLLLCLK